MVVGENKSVCQRKALTKSDIYKATDLQSTRVGKSEHADALLQKQSLNVPERDGGNARFSRHNLGLSPFKVVH